ncbi:hypothetical protein GCM10011512_13670 [Tersicoccus solisilvae]|uniref:Coproheme decarboxylase n=1 Tax=Tersicoccus solisilvae TaxID=1882339 RepID=A0ABQ1NZN6_9MICC|nr:hydrogen peroxide-dependent heme synthase [Tersicoccus solisilvae]GGC87991.1 hypothetical protein GCM10011512_13670 [Tersicoccus solisilvae]
MTTAPDLQTPAPGLSTGDPYTLWAVFARTSSPSPAAPAGELADLTGMLAEQGVTVRGFYDVSGMRADADVMVWLHARQPDALQEALRTLRRTETLAATRLVFSSMGVHREAEFAKEHSPSYYRGVPAGEWMCVYPFVRSYDWYLLDAAERGAMLRDHGLAGREYPQVIANTVQCFAMNDWEWLLGLEAPELTDLVDLMRHLRNTDARLHVREEVPFYTGRRIDPADVAGVLR